MDEPGQRSERVHLPDPEFVDGGELAMSSSIDPAAFRLCQVLGHHPGGRVANVIIGQEVSGTPLTRLHCVGHCERCGTAWVTHH